MLKTVKGELPSMDQELLADDDVFNRTWELTSKSKRQQRFSKFLRKQFKAIPSDKAYNITTSEDRKFLWYRVAKAGSRTIFDVFDRAEISFTAEHPFWVHYTPQHYEEYFKFAFVRNPWGRLVSCWQNKVKQSNHFEFSVEDHAKMQSFEKFVDYVETINVNICKDPHLRQQSTLIDLNHIDFIGRLESFEADLRIVLEHLDIEDIEISRKNAASQSDKKTSDYRDYYNDSTVYKVGQMYQKDIRLFNYQF